MSKSTCRSSLLFQFRHSRQVVADVRAPIFVGVPVAAATLGAQLQLLRPGESAALLLGALLTIAAASGAARAWSARTPSPASDAGSLSTDANHQPKPIPVSATG